MACLVAYIIISSPTSLAELGLARSIHRKNHVVQIVWYSASASARLRRNPRDCLVTHIFSSHATCWCFVSKYKWLISPLIHMVNLLHAETRCWRKKRKPIGGRRRCGGPQMLIQRSRNRPDANRFSSDRHLGVTRLYSPRVMRSSVPASWEWTCARAQFLRSLAQKIKKSRQNN